MVEESSSQDFSPRQGLFHFDASTLEPPEPRQGLAIRIERPLHSKTNPVAASGNATCGFVPGRISLCVARVF